MRVATRSLADARRDELIGLYRLIAGHTAGGCQASIYAGMRRIARVEDETVEAAFQKAALLLQDRMAEMRRARMDGIPSAAEYQDALDATPIRGSSRLVALLNAHAGRADATASLAELAKVIGADEATVRLEYGRLGRKLGAWLDLPTTGGTLNRDIAPVLSFATVSAAPGAALTITLRPAIIEALRLS